MSKSIILIGKPDSSKTVFLTQFHSRLQKRKSKLSLYKPVENLLPISASREALANGDSPQPTPTENKAEFILPIKWEENEIDLLCPEYGGEQVNQIIENRGINKEWKESLLKSNNWILFIRPNSISKPLDISDVTVSDQHLKLRNNEDGEIYTISEQSSFIELLQILLHFKNNDYHLLNSNIKLTVVLTCWDEIETKDNPRALLERKLPLFLNFVEANWDIKNFKILGLSAQGFTLDNKENKEKYQIHGPESFGYLVLPDGTKTNDITELIAQALL